MINSAKQERPPAPVRIEPVRVEPVVLDPALRIRPRFNENRAERVMNVENLLPFIDQILLSISRQNPNFNNFPQLFVFLRDEFSGVDASRLTLLSIYPVRCERNYEGYEITIQSEVPRGWIRFALTNRPGPVYADPENLQRIERVAPFDPEMNHFAALGLPFRDTAALRNAWIVHDPGIDLTQVQLISTRPVRYTYRYEAMPNLILEVPVHNGFELNFQTPNGPVRYYVNREGQTVSRPNDLQGDVILL